MQGLLFVLFINKIIFILFYYCSFIGGFFNPILVSKGLGCKVRYDWIVKLQEVLVWGL